MARIIMEIGYDGDFDMLYLWCGAIVVIFVSSFNSSTKPWWRLLLTNLFFFWLTPNLVYSTISCSVLLTAMSLLCMVSCLCILSMKLCTAVKVSKDIFLFDRTVSQVLSKQLCMVFFIYKNYIFFWSRSSKLSDYLSNWLSGLGMLGA